MENPRNADGVYCMDLEDLDTKIVKSNAKLVIFCSPHNPVGRVWTIKELEDFLRICKRRNVIVVSDEIHSDLVFDGANHIPLSEVLPDYDLSCVLASPSKTFNIPGFKVSFSVIQDRLLRESFKRACTCAGLGGPTIFGIVASVAAYRNGGPWLEAVLQSIRKNIDISAALFAEELPEVKFRQPEGTYLLWPIRSLGMTENELTGSCLTRERCISREEAFSESRAKGFSG